MIQSSDLSPENSKITIKGKEYTIKPQKLYHALMIAKFGSTFENIASLTSSQAKQLDSEVGQLISELIPDLGSVQLAPSEILEILGHFMTASQPSEVTALEVEGVSVNNDPKAEATG